MIHTIYLKLTAMALLVLGSGCNAFLEVKPDAKLSVPESLNDLRALLDDESKINRTYPGLLEMATDDYFIDYSTWATRTAFDQDIYTWKAAPLYMLNNTGQQWSNPYKNIATANVVLEGLQRLGLEATEEGRRLQGEALFVRGLGFLYLSQVYSPAYEKSHAAAQLGIPLKLRSSVDDITTRATLEDTFIQITDDFKKAAELLPLTTEYITRATKLSAYAALSRMYLFMDEYELALHYAEEVLEKRPRLMDYNELSIEANNPFPWAENVEILYFATSASASALVASTRAHVDTALFDSFSADDLRKTAFFRSKGNGLYSFKGFYTGSEVSYFAGFAVDELYLNKAECLVRLGKVKEGLDALNHLLLHRWRSGTYTPMSTTDRDIALSSIVRERRKELIRRGVRWSDIKRLNKEPTLAITLKRKLEMNGQAEYFELPPGDPRFAYLIPQDVIEMTGIEQNPR